MPGSNSEVQQSHWYDKYKVDCSAQGAPNLTFLDFGGVKEVPAEDWAAAQEIERRELAARPAALLEAQKAMYHRVKNMPMITLRDGTTMPAVGLGTWKAEKGQVRAAVHIALQAGYRHIDCASVYQNEDEVGDALEYALSRGLINRSELYICSKVWNNEHATDRVRAACLRSIKALKLEYLDLYLIHWPVTGNIGNAVTPSIKETWRALESLVKDGLVRSIGTSNFSAKKLAEIMEYAEILPSVCQVEIHPYHRNDALINWCKKNKIHVTAFSPLGSPDSESIFPRKVPAVLLKDPIVTEIAQKVGKNVGQVLVRWALQHGTSVIPKSTNPDRLRGNLDVFDWELGQKDYARLSSFKFQQRMVNGAMWLNPRGPYQTMEDLWDEPDLEDIEASDVGVCLCSEEEDVVKVEEVMKVEEKEGEKKLEKVEEKVKEKKEEDRELSSETSSSPRKGAGQEGAGRRLGGRLANWLSNKKK